jgi:transposase
MKRFVEGADRGQSTLLPECLDEWVEESNSVRVIDCFVDSLDLADLDQSVSVETPLRADLEPDLAQHSPW